MVGRRQLVRYYLLAVVGAVLLFTAAYDAGMSVFEGRHRTLLESFEFVLQTLTTTGYGQDAPWGPPMTALVVGIQISSLVLVAAAFPILIVPFVEDALRTTPPTALEEVADHVLVCHHSARTETLLDELDSRDVPGVIVEPDRETATALHERGRRVVHGDPERVRTLEAANVGDAQALVADADDAVDLSIITASREVAPGVPVYSIVDDPEFEAYHEHAGVEEAFSPRTMLGRGLANKVRTAVSTEIEGAIEVGEDFTIGELPLQPGSELTGRTVGDIDVQGRTGATLIGAWSNGQFRVPPFPDLRLDEHAVLLVAGDEPQLERLRKLTRSDLRRYKRDEVTIAGHGVVGSTVATSLAEVGVPRTVLDIEDEPGVDVVGDATDPETLREAGIEETRTVVLALDDDITTLVATFVIRDLNAETEIIARADDPESVRKLYRAGADYVLSLSSVTGRLLASRLVEEQVLSFDKQIQVVRVPVSTEGTLGELDVRGRTGCTVVAVERRDGRVDRYLSDRTEIDEHDHLIIAGMDEDIAAFNDEFR